MGQPATVALTAMSGLTAVGLPVRPGSASLDAEHGLTVACARNNASQASFAIFVLLAIAQRTSGCSATISGSLSW